MRSHQAGEKIAVYTERERIEGMLFRMAAVRLSDALNSPHTKDDPFLKLKDAVITCRKTGTELARPPFAMVARSSIVLITTDSEPVTAPA